MPIPPLISVDDHVVEPPDLWQRYLPQQYREAGPRVVKLPWERGNKYFQPVQPATSGPEVDCWLFGEIPQFLTVQLVAIGMPPDEIDGRPLNFEDVRPMCIEPKARVEAMDVISVELSLCFPNSARFCGQVFHWMADKDVALASVKAYNDWIVEEWSGESGGRLLPVCLIPLWDAGAAAAEVRRNAARGARAVAFCELPTALGLPSIHSAEGYWDPFFRACDETGTVICLHIGSSSTTAATSPDAPLAVSMSATSFNAQLALSEWLFSGNLPRFPNLKIALSESQIGWVPFMLERCDRIWRTGNVFARIPETIVEPPSHYFAKHVWGCFFEDDFGLQSRDLVGVDRITFESDFPHQDSTWPDTQEYFAKISADLTEDEIYKIARGNAIQMLGLPEEAR